MVLTSPGRALGALLFALSCSFQTANAQRVVYHGGVIITADSARPRADWFVTEGSRILAVGTGAVPDSLSRSASIVELAGRVVVPGLIDAHVHMVDAGLALANDWSDVTTSEALRQRLRTALANIRGEHPLVGRNVLESPMRQLASPIRTLDSVSSSVPILLFLRSGHAAVANSAAMRHFGLARGAARDAAGHLTGWLLEDAAMDASRAVVTETSRPEIARAVLALQTRALAYGITTIGDNTFAPHHYKLLQVLARQGDLVMRVRSRSFGPLPITTDLMRTLGTPKLGLFGTAPDPTHIRYHATKYFVDQSLSLPASAVASRPGGTTLLSQREIAALLRADPKAVMAFHVQGDSALLGILNAVQTVQGTNAPRHVIDHAGYASAELLARVKLEGLALTAIGPQIFDRASLVTEYRRRSDARVRESDLLDVVAHVRNGGAALTSDAPYGQDSVIAGHPEADGFNPWATMAAVTLGVGPDGTPIPGLARRTLTLDEALVATTSRGAWALGDERLVGRIAPGLRADFAMLRTNVAWTASPALFANDVVERTYIDGREVYRRGATVASAAVLPDVSPSDWTVSPVIGYDPAFGTLLGGALFSIPLSSPGTLSSVQLQASTSGKFASDASLTRFGAWPNGTVTFSANASTFQQPYFGEGRSTLPTARRYLDGVRWRGRVEATQTLRGAWRASLALDARSRRETSVRDSNNVIVPAVRIAPNETGLAFSIGLQHDTRDEPANARTGHLVAVQSSFIPAPAGATGATGATLLSTDIRRFHVLPFRGTVLALRGIAGVSWGTPSYAWRYSLGGATLLRGAWDNRFRGARMWATQGELRIPVATRLSLAGFGDFGAVGESGFSAPVLAAGGGMRFALRRTVVLRLDYGATRDQHGIFFTFLQAF